ncbi:hypothetical protein KBB59_02110 [Candidatus Woesebacteria bacterium]|jgi:hypothetical protein|nr:hypothetical protein [Candidatus Woesebacteria bacterium]HNV44847.1 hypothetical protein [Candidatus Woesebacteria bacterium]HOC07527.1 hypothetical protein [Candidatus Woesebacteria bacterium]HOP38967.1 hypothetical protein [Candidatus Woesebacteria bacterium]HPA61860.1 hypothetical protein [Candidatus Woesebacteria bacterium]
MSNQRFVKKNTSTEPTLSNINYFSRVGLKFVVIALVFLMVGRVVWNVFTDYWARTHPAPPPPPTVGFGVLPQLNFPLQEDETKPKEYILEMAGTLTDPVDQMKVYFMPKPAVSLLTDEKVKEIAAKYGFIFAPEIISGDLYRFTKTQPLDTSLEINATYLNFSISSNYLAKPELLITDNTKRLPEEFEAVERVKNFLIEGGLMPKDVATSSGVISYKKSLGGELTPALSLSDADFVTVDLNRVPIDDYYPIYTPAGEKGVISAVISGAFTGSNSIVEVDYYYHEVDYSTFETYPLRGVKSAWKMVQAGEGYIASGQNLERAVIRSVELAYFDDFEYQPFLQPIYVFKGDDNFLAYVSAIHPNYLERE